MAKDKKNGVDIREVYTLVEDMRKEFSASLLRLETKFDTLEAGRLSHLEKEFANFQGRMAIVAGIVSFAVGLLFLILNRYFG